MRIVGMMALGGAIALSSPAAAQKDTKATSAAKDVSRDNHKDANEYFKSGDFEHARAAYLAAYSVNKDAKIAYLLGNCEMELKRYREAAEHLSSYLLRYPEDPDQARAKRAHELFAQAREHIAVIQVYAQEKADILLDGVIVGNAPLLDDLFVDPGLHRLEARFGQLTSPIEKVNVPAGERRLVRLEVTALVEAERKGREQGKHAARAVDFIIVGGVLALGIPAGIWTFVEYAWNKEGKNDQAATLGAWACSVATASARTCVQSAIYETRSPYLGGIALATSLAGVLGTGMLIWGISKYPKSDALKVGFSLTPSSASGFLQARF